MKHFFIDTNVALDLLAKRLPFAVEAIQLFEAAAQSQVTLYVASLSFSNLHYILRKAAAAVAVELLTDLTLLVRVLPVDATTVQQALASDLTDFEDALQYFAATSAPAVEAIITRDPKGFRHSTLPVLTPAEALQQLR